MIYILCAALLFMIVTSVVLIRNRFEFKSINDPIDQAAIISPKVSICVPARNEENVIERCVRSLLNQNYSNFEVLVLDDNSDDDTPAILQKFKTEFDNLIILSGAPKPDSWHGKPWACHQMSTETSGDIIVFVDADVWMEPFVITNTVANLEFVDALTIWPEQELGGFIEKLVIPSIMFSLVTLLPAIYTERAPRWMPKFFYKHLKGDLAAACGQFFAMNRSTYDAINGHEIIKNHVVEDVELGRILRRNDFILTMKTGVNSVYCRMYNSATDVWNGFLKNFYPGFGSPITFIIAAFMHALFFLYPFYTLFISIQNGETSIRVLSLFVIALYILQRLILNLWFKWDWWMALFHPFAVLWFQLLGVKSLFNRVFKVKSIWKGRQV